MNYHCKFMWLYKQGAEDILSKFVDKYCLKNTTKYHNKDIVMYNK